MKLKTLALFFIFLIISLPIAIASETASYDLIYDENGNLIQDENKYYEYNSLNQLVKVRADGADGLVIAEFFYDDNGNRIKKIEYKETGQEITYYVNDNFVRVSDSSGTKDVIYYYHNDELIGKKDFNGNKFFYHPDILGSTRIVTNEGGEIVEKTSYLPFGEVIEGGDSRFLFTGQEKDKETDLMYYGARYYSPFLRSFTQADTVLPNVYDPQTLNRYSYVRNNPLKYKDETGHWFSPMDFLDYASLAESVYSLITDPSWENLGWFTLDLGCAIVPVFGGLGAAGKGLKYAAKAANKADDVKDAVKAVNKIDNVKDATKKTYGVYDKTKDAQRFNKNVNKLKRIEDVTVRSQKEGTAAILTAHPGAKKIKYVGKELSPAERKIQQKIWKNQRNNYGTKYQYHTQWNSRTQKLVGHPAGGAHAKAGHVHIRYDDPAKKIHKEAVVTIEK